MIVWKHFIPPKKEEKNLKTDFRYLSFFIIGCHKGNRRSNQQ